MVLPWEHLRLVLAVVRHGTLAGAGRALGMSPAAFVAGIARGLGIDPGDVSTALTRPASERFDLSALRGRLELRLPL